MDKKIALLVGTRKGAFIIKQNGNESWEVSEPILLGSSVNHFVQNPYDKEKMVLAAKTGHLGPTIFLSEDQGKTWKEASVPPKFAKEGKRSVKYTFWLQPGHESENKIWYAGTSPIGLFRSEDNGDTWMPISGFNDNEMREKWAPDQYGTPDGAIVHSINIDPRDPLHMYIGISIGGVFETLDGGKTWKPLNEGVLADYMPEKYPEYGQDPHTMVQHPKNPDILWQQNHCGIYRIDRGEGNKWTRVGENMPKEVGDIGFPIVLDPEDPDRAWTFPMDGTNVWPRTSPGGIPTVYTTKDGGSSWESKRSGLPEKAWFTVLRQAMCGFKQDKQALFFGTTSGEIWGSHEDGEGWYNVAEHLPKIYSIQIAYLN